MSEAKFTKGEWIAFFPHAVLSNGHLSVETDDGSLIYVREVYESTLDEQTANAHLIAAAPEMYEMLESIENDNQSIPSGLWEKIQKVLAKARGE